MQNKHSCTFTLLAEKCVTIEIVSFSLKSPYMITTSNRMNKCKLIKHHKGFAN